MILHALKEYYDRLARDPDSGIPPFGYSRERISWAIVIDRDGNLVPPIRDLRNHDSKKPTPREISVPQRVKKTNNISPNFLWGNSGYVLGADEKGNKDRSLNKHKAFCTRLHEIGDSLNDEGMKAVLLFVDRWDPTQAELLENWEKICGTNLVFRLEYERGFVHDRQDVRSAYLQSLSENDPNTWQLCLLTGEKAPISRLHPKIKNVKKTEKNQGDIVSFNEPAFQSFGKKQGDNAPIGEESVFAYTTALNWLLRRDSSQKIQIGDATTVFWAERSSIMERSLYYMLNPDETGDKDEISDDTASAISIRSFLDAARNGRLNEFNFDRDVRFYILGLSPNVARIAIRFWHVDTVGELGEKISRHYHDMDIEHGDNAPMPSISQLLCETAVERKKDNVPPLLAGAFIRSILIGQKYPETLLSLVINRIRADRDTQYRRMMLIKGCLIRNHNREVTMSLDKTQTEAAYLLGRLFAVLEKAQKDALKITTIKERYFSSASTVPHAVFPILLRLNQHHVAKGTHGGFYTHLISEIMEMMQAKKMPTHMSLADQGLFVIGYYHQRNALFRKHETTETETTE